jgi:hypothetical protein
VQLTTNVPIKAASNSGTGPARGTAGVTKNGNGDSSKKQITRVDIHAAPSRIVSSAGNKISRSAAYAW